MYLFLLGRDPELSKLEIVSFLSSRNINYKIVDSNSRYLIIDFLEDNKDNSKNTRSNFINNLNLRTICDELGGITRVAKIYLSTKDISHINYMDYLEKYFSKKFNYCISSIDVDLSLVKNIEERTKDYFKSQKYKAVLKKPRRHGGGVNTVANPENYYSWKLDNGFEIFVFRDKRSGVYYFAETISCFTPKINVFKDKSRPKKKHMYNTSFRLVDILINILGAKKGNTIVDPFCGTGTFLIELLNKGYNVVGVDKSKDMYHISKNNVDWAIKEFKLKNTYKLINTSSSLASFKAQGAVFEPYMGPFLYKSPPYKKAKRIIEELNEIYFGVFTNLNKRLASKSKVVCILPDIKTNDNKIVSLRRDLFSRTGFKLVDVNNYRKDIRLRNCITYATPSGSKLLRKIYVLQKI